MNLNHSHLLKLAAEWPKIIFSCDNGPQLPQRILLICCALILGSSTSASAQTVKVVSPKGGTASAPIISTGGARLVLKFTVSDAAATPKVRIVDDAGISNGYDDFTVQGDGEQKVTLNLLSGKNKITLFGYSGEPSSINVTSSPQTAPIWIQCDDDECGTAKELIANDKQQPAPRGGGGSKTDGNLVIKSPTGDVAEGPVQSIIWVKGGLKKLAIAVYDSEGNRVDYKASVDVKTFDNLELAFATLKLVQRQNVIRVFDPENLGDKNNEAMTVVNCTGGEKCGKLEAAGAAAPKPTQKGTIHINSPKMSSISKDPNNVPLGILVDRKANAADNVKKLSIKVVNEKKEVTQESNTLTVPDPPADNLTKQAELGFNLKILKGLNKVTVTDFDHPETELDYVEVYATESALMTVDNPEPGETLKSSFRDAYLTVAKDSGINKIKYYVLHEGSTVVKAADVEEVEVKYEGDKGTAVVPIKVVEGENVITFFDVSKPLDQTHQASLRLICEGPKCANDFQIATTITNSMTTRAVVGMEQVGASSASSETKPFLDFFFTGSLRSKTNKELRPVLNPDGSQAQGPDGKLLSRWVAVSDPVPRFGTWGQVRFSTTPQQTASASVFPSNFVSQITDPTKVIDLVQSFDFLGGVELRAFSSNGWNWTMIPGVKQKSRFYFTFGGGAITPLNAARVSAQIFKIPPAASGSTPAGSQRAEFERRFGVPPVDKTYVGFVPLERDRFYRQYYFGIRLKSHYCDDDDCTRFKNRFPSIIDFGIGQNEAVTGGTFRQNGKRALVMRFDAFYNLPFRDAKFLYLYGTTMMKLGQGGPRIDNPLFLDTAPGEVQITGTDVFIPPADQQPARLNRDYYKIGIGVNLTDLFNRNKTPPE